MESVVKILKDDNGEAVKKPVWHYVHIIAGGNATLCGGEYFGYGESRCVYISKKGKITCPNCIEIIKQFKAIKL